MKQSRTLFFTVISLCILILSFQNCSPFEANSTGDTFSSEFSSEQPTEAPTLNDITCNLKTDKTEVIEGAPVTLTLDVTGIIDQASVNGEILNLELNNSITFTPTADTVYSAEIKNSEKIENCNSSLIKVLPKEVETAASCKITASKSLVKFNETITINFELTGVAQTATFNGNNVGTQINQHMQDVTVTEDTSYTGQVFDAAGKSTACSVDVKLDEMTEAEFFIAKIGPGGLSINDLITRDDQCAKCHVKDSVREKAEERFALDLENPFRNLNIIKNINAHSSVWKDLTIADPCGLVILTFAPGTHHRSSRGLFSTAEQNFIQKFCDSY